MLTALSYSVGYMRISAVDFRAEHISGNSLDKV